MSGVGGRSCEREGRSQVGSRTHSRVGGEARAGLRIAKRSQFARLVFVESILRNEPNGGESRSLSRSWGTRQANRNEYSLRRRGSRADSYSETKPICAAVFVRRRAESFLRN